MRTHGITPALCRAARNALNLSQARLAELARVSRPVVQDFERGGRIPIGNNLQAIKRALEGAGVIFQRKTSSGFSTVTLPDPDATD